MIHAKITLLALAAAAAAFVLAPPAQASVISYDFTATITSGPLPSGTVENGSFSYDSSSIVPNGSNDATGLLTALAFTLNGITYNASTANTGFLTFKVGDLASFSFGSNCFVGGCGASATTNSWYASPGSDGFAYGVSGGSSVGFGNVTFAPAAVPEPGSLALLATAILGLGLAGLVRRRSARS